MKENTACRILHIVAIDNVRRFTFCAPNSFFHHKCNAIVRGIVSQCMYMFEFTISTITYTAFNFICKMKMNFRYCLAYNIINNIFGLEGCCFIIFVVVAHVVAAAAVDVVANTLKDVRASS